MEKRSWPASLWSPPPWRSGATVGGLTQWREWILWALYFYGSLTGLAVYPLTMWYLLRQGRRGMVAVDTLALACALMVWLLGSRLGLRLRSLLALAIMYAVGMMILLGMGPVFCGTAWLFGFGVMAGILLGWQAAVAAMAVNALGLGLAGWVVVQGLAGWAAPADISLEGWLVSGVNFILLNGLVAITAAVMLRGLEMVFQRAQETRLGLEEQKASLDEAHARLASILTAAPVGIGVVVERRIMEVNQAFCQMTGYQHHELIGQPARMLYPSQEDYDHVGREQYGQLASQGTGTVETRWQRQDGTILEVLLSSAAIQTGRPEAGVTLTALDITQRKWAEKALRVSEEKHRALLEESMDPIYSLEPDGTYSFANQALAAPLGLTPQEMVGKRLWDIFPSPEADQRFLVARQVFALGQPLVVEEKLQAGGRDFYYVTSAKPLTGPDGQVESVLCVSKDISERKRSEAVLAESEARLRQAQAMAQVGSWEIDLISKTIWASEEAFRIYGLEQTSSTMPLKMAQDVVHPEDRPRNDQALADLVRRGVKYDIEFRILKADTQELRHIHSLAALEYAEDGRPQKVVGTMKDITQEKKAQEEKASLAAQLRQAQKIEALGILAGGIAHDFNNILGAIIGFTELASQAARQGHDNQDDLEQVLKSSLRARDLVRKILTFSRRVEPDLRPLDLNQTVEQTRRMLERIIPRMVTIETHPWPSPCLVSADASQMEQVLVNLAVNAADAMPEGGQLVIETQIVELDEEYSRRYLDVTPGSYALLLVSDTGQGMDEATREHLFEPFFTTKEVGKGTGLGLATVHGVVRSHGGQIHCYSEPGLGTTFKLYLPVYQGAAPASPQAAGLDSQYLKGNETVLLVDDEEALRAMASNTLASVGYRVLTAASGEEALEVYQRQAGEVDLVILDLGMPGMGGKRCLAELLALDPTVKVIIASGYSANGPVKEALEAGASGYLAKPYRLADLLVTIRGALNH